MSEYVPGRIWIQKDHIPDECALNQWDQEPDSDEAPRFAGYWSDDLHATAIRDAVEAERERCARLCENQTAGWNTDGTWTLEPHDGQGTHGGMCYAAAIRTPHTEQEGDA